MAFLGGQAAFSLTNFGAPIFKSSFHISLHVSANQEDACTLEQVWSRTPGMDHDNVRMRITSLTRSAQQQYFQAAKPSSRSAKQQSADYPTDRSIAA
jgi:hypothetical protein